MCFQSKLEVSQFLLLEALLLMVDNLQVTVPQSLPPSQNFTNWGSVLTGSSKTMVELQVQYEECPEIRQGPGPTGAYIEVQGQDFIMCAIENHPLISAFKKSHVEQLDEYESSQLKKKKK